jgi:radical SAM superfamily enzyme
MKPHELKIHLLHILENTRLGEEFKKGNVGVMTREEYVSTVCDQLEVIPQETVIGRITGDGAPNDLLAPEWSRKKLVVMNEIDKELVRRNSMQGAKYKGN